MTCQGELGSCQSNEDFLEFQFTALFIYLCTNFCNTANALTVLYHTQVMYLPNEDVLIQTCTLYHVIYDPYQNTITDFSSYYH